MLKFFFLAHLCSSLQGTLCNLYALLFFIVDIEDNVSFQLGGGTWDDLDFILFYVNIFIVIFSDFSFSF